MSFFYAIGFQRDVDVMVYWAFLFNGEPQAQAK
jgi:hypothetical protein